MRIGLKSRLTQLERNRQAEKPTYGQVIWLGPDGFPDPPDQVVTPERPLIYLPRKASSPEAWVQDVRQRGWQAGQV